MATLIEGCKPLELKILHSNNSHIENPTKSLNLSIISSHDQYRPLTLRIVPESTVPIQDNNPRINPASTVPIQDNNRRSKFDHIKRYTLSIFLERARAIHGDKYNYDNIKEDDIRGVRSEIVIVCNHCSYMWTT